MPRPKPKKAQPTFLAHPHSLREKTKEKLKALLGNNEARVISEVENALGLYINGAVHMDDIPRPADYVSTFKPISKNAMKLLKTLHGLGGYYSAQFSKNGADQDMIEADLIKLINVANDVVKNYETMPSVGAPKNNALTEVTKRLRRIFRGNYKGPVIGRRMKNNIQFRGEEEKRELAFVEAALLDAKIIKVRGSENTVARLFLDPRCAMRHERAAVIERIANKVRRSRQQKGNE